MKQSIKDLLITYLFGIWSVMAWCVVPIVIFVVPMIYIDSIWLFILVELVLDILWYTIQQIVLVVTYTIINGKEC